MTISTEPTVSYRDDVKVIDLQRTSDGFSEKCEPLIRDVLGELDGNPSEASDWMYDIRDTFLHHLKDHCEEQGTLCV